MNPLENFNPDNPERNAVERLPEECRSPEEFNRCLQARQEKLESELDQSDQIKSKADDLAAHSSLEELLKAKKELGDPAAFEAAYLDACVGDHEKMDSKALAEMQATARKNWEKFQVDSHIYDMALSRWGWQPGDDVYYIPVDYHTPGSALKGPDQAIRHTMENAGFHTSSFSADFNPPAEGIKNELVNSIEKSGTVPAPLNDREGVMEGFAEQMIRSGENIQKREVSEGESFVRICANEDSGRSPYFTTMKAIEDIAYQDRDGVMFLNEDRFRDRFSVPESSKLEQCEIYKAKEDFPAYSSTVASSSELWNQVRHSGGGEQILIADRSHLEKKDSLQIILCSDEEFQKKQAE